MAQRTGAAIVRRPIPLRGVLNATGNQSPAEVPANASHLHGDSAR